MRLECSIQLHQNPNVEISLLRARAWFKGASSYLNINWSQFHKGDGKIRDSAQKGRNSRERRSRREVLSIVLLSHDSQTTKQTFFSAEPNRRVVSDDDGVGSRIFFKDWRSLEQNQQIEVNDNTRANAER